MTPEPDPDPDYLLSALLSTISINGVTYSEHLRIGYYPDTPAVGVQVTNGSAGYSSVDANYLIVSGSTSGPVGLIASKTGISITHLALVNGVWYGYYNGSWSTNPVGINLASTTSFTTSTQDATIESMISNGTEVTYEVVS